MPNNIKISQLNIIPSVTTSDDFIPLVDSASLTTYRVSISNFNTWFAQSGSVLSASWASASKISGTATASISSSWASSSISSSATLHLIYPNSSTASFGQTSLSSSWAISSSNAIRSFAATSASWASSSISSSYAATASFTYTSSYVLGVSNFASSSISSSWASSSISASYAKSSSWSDTASYIAGLGGAATDPYPYISKLAFSSSYWDVLNFDTSMNTTYNISYINGDAYAKAMITQRYPYADNPAHIIEYDTGRGFYTGSRASFPNIVTPLIPYFYGVALTKPWKSIELFMDYRINGAPLWYFGGNFYVEFMLDAHTKMIHTYVPGAANYKFQYLGIYAEYAKAGEVAAINLSTLSSTGNKVAFFPSFTSATITV